MGYLSIHPRKHPFPTLSFHAVSLSLLAPSVSFPLSPRFPRKDREKGAERMLKTFPEASKGYRLGWSGATYFSAASETNRVAQNRKRSHEYIEKKATLCRRGALGAIHI